MFAFNAVSELTTVWDERSNREISAQHILLDNTGKKQTISAVSMQFNHQSWSKYQFWLSVGISCQAEGVDIESESSNNCTQKVILASLCILAGLKKLRYLILAEKRLFMGVTSSTILPVAGRCVACVLASSVMYRYRSIELSHSCQFPHLTHGLCNIYNHESHLLPSRSRTNPTGVCQSLQTRFLMENVTNAGWEKASGWLLIAAVETAENVQLCQTV